MIESHFLNKEDITYEYKGIVCKGSVLTKRDLRYYGSFFEKNGEPIVGWGIAGEYETVFKSRARHSINKIRDCRGHRWKDAVWKENNDSDSIGCVFDIMPDVFRQRIIDGKYDTSLNEKVPGGDYEVPLPYVTKAWDYLLRGTLCSNDFRVEYGFECDDLPVWRTKELAVGQNEQMKAIWKEFFAIDIDALDVDFTKFNMHLPPNVGPDVVYSHFQDVPEGIEEWILNGIHTPTGCCSFDAVSSLMEFAAYIGAERNHGRNKNKINKHKMGNTKKKDPIP